MNEQVKSFVQKLQDYKKGKQVFEIKEYEPEKYNCEIATLLQEARVGNYTQECLTIWSEIYSKTTFELHHPTKNHILTRAVANFYHPTLSY